jgi:hypothetical protein
MPSIQLLAGWSARALSARSALGRRLLLMPPQQQWLAAAVMASTSKYAAMRDAILNLKLGVRVQSRHELRAERTITGATIPRHSGVVTVGAPAFTAS